MLRHPKVMHKIVKCLAEAVPFCIELWLTSRKASFVGVHLTAGIVVKGFHVRKEGISCELSPELLEVVHVV